MHKLAYTIAKHVKYIHKCGTHPRFNGISSADSKSMPHSNGLGMEQLSEE